MLENISTMINNKVLFMGRYGSINYNTSDGDSDKDWRGFIQYHDGDTITLDVNGNDICINGLNQLEEMLVSMHPKALEILFSQEVLVHTDAPQQEIAALFEMKDEIVTMNTKQLYTRYLQEYGMHRYLIRENKYPHIIPKYYAHAYRLLDILQRFYDTDFNNFKHALRYEDQEANRHFYMNAAKGKVPLHVLDKKLNKKLEKIESLRESFEREKNHTAIDKLGQIFKNMQEVM